MKKIKVAILCGGQGTRIRDVSEILPKPMLSIGNRPILWHIMKIYSHYGLKDFVLCLGYKGWLIKEFFLNYYARVSDITIDLSKERTIIYHNKNDEADWKITLVETGETAQTGARIWNARKYLEDCDMFSVTYGDGVGDINIQELIKFHKKTGLSGTLTGVHPSGRFGELEAEGNVISQFAEKPNVTAGLINGGFMIFSTSVFKKYFREGDDLFLEGDVIGNMVQDKNMALYEHKGFWQCVDTPREYNLLNALWEKGNAPWKIWE